MQQLEKFNALVRDLDAGRVRVAERTDGEWKVNSWVKETILEGFRYGKLTDMSEGQFSFFDKDTIPARKFSADDGVRIVPGGSAVRTGAYLAPSVIVMPPSYINIGAYVDADTMNCGIYEGTIVRENAVIATGVIINSSTAIYDATSGRYIRANAAGQMIVPEGAVVVAGSRPVTKGPGAQDGIHIYTPVIVKYRDAKTAASVVLEDLLR